MEMTGSGMEKLYTDPARAQKQSRVFARRSHSYACRCRLARSSLSQMTLEKYPVFVETFFRACRLIPVVVVGPRPRPQNESGVFLYEYGIRN
jgi:hypothetical protein